MSKTILGCTHYVIDKSHGNGFVHAFATDTCETCGRTVEAPNAVGLKLVDCRRAGLVEAPTRLFEQYYDEDRGAGVCEGCMNDEPEDDGTEMLTVPESGLAYRSPRTEDAAAVRALAANMKHFAGLDDPMLGKLIVMAPEVRDRVVSYLTELADLYEKGAVTVEVSNV